MATLLCANMKAFHLKQFNELGLAEPILRAITDEGYTHPTPIQSAVIPAMLYGRDILGTAQTGTGKTAAFTLPLLHKIAIDKKQAPGKCCSVLILAPTRELALQIAESIETYGRHMRPSVAVVMGGVKPGPQVRAMARGVDFLVATPGRLLDLMGSGSIRLDMTKTVVLDEADQMMDLGFLPAIRRILHALPHQRQTALLSATMPKQIRALAQDFLNDPEEISVAPVSRPIETIDQSVVMVDRGMKLAALVAALSVPDMERAIVFSRTKHGADKIVKKLEHAGIRAAAIHGNKSQNQRERTLDNFKTGKVTILIATDIAARGIDVEGISHVINFDLPNVSESYVHRIGRTARAGESGIAIAFCDGEERPLLRDIEKLIGYRLAVRTLEGEGLSDPKPAPDIPDYELRPAKKKKRPSGRGGAQHRGRPGQGGKPKAQSRSQNGQGGQRSHGGHSGGQGNAEGAEAGLARMLQDGGGRGGASKRRRNRRRKADGGAASSG